MLKYKFHYAGWPGATVTVKAKDQATARTKARVEMDRRYAKAEKEPPVGWTLVMAEGYPK